MAEYYGNICTCRKCNGIVHTIRRGDTLYLLSRHYNVTVGEIMRANSNINVYNLQIGDQICIPTRRNNQSQIQPRMQNGEDNGNSNINDYSINTTIESNDNVVRMNGSRNADNNDMMREEISDEYEEISNARATMENDMESKGCCNKMNMKVRDIMNNEDMTLEELAHMLKDM